jgi:hypothetical protein
LRGGGIISLKPVIEDLLNKDTPKNVDVPDDKTSFESEIEKVKSDPVFERRPRIISALIEDPILAKADTDRADSNEVVLKNKQHCICPLCKKEKEKKQRRRLYNRIVCADCRNVFALSRIGACFIDVISLGGIGFFGLLLIFSIIPTFLQANLVLYFITLILFYFKDVGYSPGKYLFGLRVITIITGKPIDIIQSFKRNLALSVAGIFAFYGLMDGLRLGDDWAKSMVIWKKYADNPVFRATQEAEYADDFWA